MNSQEQSQHQLLILVAIIAVALNLRPAIAAIGPLADMIENHTSLNSSGVGLLSTLPIFFMGVGALSVKYLRLLFGEERGISIGLFVIFISCLARLWLHTGIGLIVTAISAGVGIASIQALLPAFIKRHFGKDTGRIIGFYSSAIVGGAVIAAASAAELAHYFNWVQALTFWALPAAITLLLWFFMEIKLRDNKQNAIKSAIHQGQYWNKGRSWSLLFFFGIGTGAFMLILAWLPAYYVSLGKSPEFSGYLLATFTFIELITAFFLSSIVNQFPDRRGLLLAALFLIIAGLGCLILSPLKAMWIAVSLLGIGIGLLFPLSLIITIDHINDPAQAGDFSAFVTGGGYIIASAIPFIAGWIRDSFSSLSDAWLLMGAGIAVLIIIAIQYSPSSYETFKQKLSSP